ncbi:MAG: hypothetical protein CL402_04000 [Acidiferrobacteraceae bacterium]|nr:hypothetical protein [Acidiferrobacteraceae bacterium]
MGSYLNDAALDLFDFALSTYILILVLYLLLRFTRSDNRNPISQLIIKASRPILSPLYLLIPIGRSIQLPSIIALIALEFLRILSIYLSAEISPSFSGVLILSIGKLVQLTIYTIIFLLFSRSIISWIANNNHHFAITLLYSMTEPMLRRARTLIPIGGFIDWSPILLFVFLMLCLRLIVQPLLDFGISLI